MHVVIVKSVHFETVWDSIGGVGFVENWNCGVANVHKQI